MKIKGIYLINGKCERLTEFRFFVEKYNLVLIGPKWCHELDKKFSFRQKCLNRNILTTKVGYSNGPK